MIRKTPSRRVGIAGLRCLAAAFLRRLPGAGCNPTPRLRRRHRGWRGCGLCGPRTPEQFGDPIISANGQQVGRSVPGVAFYHDFPPGTYAFTVQSYGTPTNAKDTVQLAPGSTDLSRGLVGRQLAGRHCRRRHLLCADAGAAAGPGLCQDVVWLDLLATGAWGGPWSVNILT